jgi:hypothetical protein
LSIGGSIRVDSFEFAPAELFNRRARPGRTSSRSVCAAGRR